MINSINSLFKGGKIQKLISIFNFRTENVLKKEEKSRSFQFGSRIQIGDSLRGEVVHAGGQSSGFWVSGKVVDIYNDGVTIINTPSRWYCIMWTDEKTSYCRILLTEKMESQS